MPSHRAAAHFPTTILLAAAVAGCTLGCQVSLPYAPRPSPRVQIVERRLAKNGQLFDFSHLGALVQGNPAAENEARAYASAATTSTVLNTMGFLSDLGGLGVIVGGAAARDKTEFAFGLTLALIGANFGWIASLASDRAHDHVTNAVNLYNDGLPPEALAPRAPSPVNTVPLVPSAAPAPPAYPQF